MRRWARSTRCGPRSPTPTCTCSPSTRPPAGQGLGGELLDRGLAAARDAGLVACLDTMNPANVPFYEAHGMSVRHEVRLGADGPTSWAMATG